MEPEIKIVNVVVSTKIGDNIDLEEVAMILENAEYEPEQFPGLVYRLDDPKVVVLIFGSGKVVITGLKSEEDAKRALKKILDTIKEVQEL